MNDEPSARAPAPAGPAAPASREESGREPEMREGMYRDSIGYALWCLFFVGLAGVHRIYLGKYGTGILWLLTWGLFGIGQFVDLFRMRSLVQDANVRDGYLPHPRIARWLGRPPSPPAPTGERQPSPLQQLLRAAERHGGALSVTQAVAATGLPFAEAERLLRDMVADGYVDVDNAPGTGVVIYRFPELSGGA